MRQYTKAIVAALGALCGGAAIASQDGWTQPEVWTVLGAVVVQAGAVWGIPNKLPGYNDDDVAPDEE